MLKNAGKTLKTSTYILCHDHMYYVTIITDHKRDRILIKRLYLVVSKLKQRCPPRPPHVPNGLAFLPVGYKTMASASTSQVSHPVVFTTQTPYSLPSQKFMIPASWKRYQLSQLVNKALSLPKPIPFDFLVRGEILRTTLGEWCAEKGIGEVCPIVCFLSPARLNGCVAGLKRMSWS